MGKWSDEVLHRTETCIDSKQMKQWLFSLTFREINET